MHRSVVYPFFVMIVSLLAGCGGDSGDGPLLPLPGFGGDGIAYVVAIKGESEDVEIDSDLQDKLEAASQLIVLQDQEPASRAALRRRVAGDVEGLGSVLRAEGYYGGAVKPEIDAEADPVEIVLTIAPGARYSVVKYDIVFVGDHVGAEPLPPDDGDFGFVKGMPARGEGES